MDDLQDLSFKEIMQKMNQLQLIETNWRENKNLDEVLRGIKAVNLADLTYLTSQLSEPKAIMITVKLFFYKLFAIINLRIKDLVMSYKDDPSKLQELQGDMAKLFNIDLSTLDLGNPFGFTDETKENKDEENKPESDKKHTLN